MLVDKYNRYFYYLRISITDLCNFNCKYCLPSGVKIKIKNYLSVKEIYNLVLAFSELGIEKIRLTGGEPTVRKDFISIGKMISTFKNIKSLVFTTNGYKLSDIAGELTKAGFTGVNVSLDTFNKSKFSAITGKDYLFKVYEGVLYSINIGLDVKLNVVLSDFFSFDDFEDFYSILKYKKLIVRFIDQMGTNFNLKSKNKFLNSDYIISFLKKNGWTLEKKKDNLSGPSDVYCHNNFIGKIGIIAPYSENFCLNCNRLRVSCTGDLFLCLFGGQSYCIRNFLKSKDLKEEFKKFLINKIKLKFSSHSLLEKNFGIINSFYSIGG